MNSESPFDADLMLAHRLADEASVVSLPYHRREIRRWAKSDGSLVTEADLAVEDALRAILAIERPQDAILGEERGLTGSGNRRWIIDAIDGTIDFAAGGSDWAALIALEVDGQVVVGVCDKPVRKRRCWAAKGQGAFCGPTPSLAPTRLAVSTIYDLKAARSSIPAGRWLPDERARKIADVLSKATTPTLQIEHPAALQVAAGTFEVAVSLIAGPWDLAALALIVEEAGGRFTNIEGRNDLSTGTAVFSNGAVHADILRLISQT